MTTDKSISVVLTVAGVLFGFLFAGFWWILNREIDFKPEDRHFKPSTAMLLVSMGLVAVFGIALPLKSMAAADNTIKRSYHGIVLAMIGIFGYMLTEMGHYSMFQRPKYTTKLEWFWMIVTCLTATIAILFMEMH